MHWSSPDRQSRNIMQKLASKERAALDARDQLAADNTVLTGRVAELRHQLEAAQMRYDRDLKARDDDAAAQAARMDELLQDRDDLQVRGLSARFCCFVCRWHVSLWRSSNRG
jgi:hypothetical protein